MFTRDCPRRARLPKCVLLFIASAQVIGRSVFGDEIAVLGFESKVILANYATEPSSRTRAYAPLKVIIFLSRADGRILFSYTSSLEIPKCEIEN